MSVQRINICTSCLYCDVKTNYCPKIDNTATGYTITVDYRICPYWDSKSKEKKGG